MKLRMRAAAAACLAVMVAPAQPAREDKAAAYYHAAMGHLYEELAGAYGGRGEYLSKAVENYRAAMKADPGAAILAEQLADLYIGTGQVRSATAEFEGLLRQNPGDLNARRILGRIYMSRIREGQQGRPNEEMLKRALEQFKTLSEKAPADLETWLAVGRLQKLAQNSTESEKAFKKALELSPENEDAMAGLAMVYADLGDNAGAAAMLKRVAEKNPSVRTLATLAGSYEQMREYKLAAQAYKGALEMNKDNLDLKRAYAQALFAAEDGETAQKVFEEILGAEPNDVLANLRLSQIHRQKKQLKEAYAYARKARQLEPGNLEIRFNEVSLLEVEGKTQEAINTLKATLDGIARTTATAAERGNRIILLERLGFLYRQAEQTEQAVAAFREIGQLDPSIAGRAAALVVETLRAAREFAAAEKEAAAALKQYPDERVVRVTAASLYADTGQHEQAQGLLRSLLDGKGDREIYISLAQLLEKAKDYKGMGEAIDAAEKLAKTPEERQTAVFLRGAMLEKQKKFDAAEAEFRKVIEADPGSASALNYLGYMLADRGTRLQEALQLIQKAVEQEPYNPAYLDSLGWVYFKLNRLEEAAVQLRLSLERSSTDATVYDHLGDVYLSQGKLKDAITQWERSLKEFRRGAPADRDEAEVAKVQKKLDSARVRLAKEGTAKKQP